MSIYAKNTAVSVEKSRAEIESILSRYGASAFAYATNMNRAMIQFQAEGRRIMFVLELPDRNADQFLYRTWGSKIRKDQKRPKLEAYTEWERSCRQKWRCLALAIKAKLESVESGISAFEDEFLAHIVMPDGKTVSHHLRPKIEAAYKTGTMPPLLPHFGAMQ